MLLFLRRVWFLVNPAMKGFVVIAALCSPALAWHHFSRTISTWPAAFAMTFWTDIILGCAFCVGATLWVVLAERWQRAKEVVR